MNSYISEGLGNQQLEFWITQALKFLKPATGLCCISSNQVFKVSPIFSHVDMMVKQKVLSSPSSFQFILHLCVHTIWRSVSLQVELTCQANFVNHNDGDEVDPKDCDDCKTCNTVKKVLSVAKLQVETDICYTAASCNRSLLRCMRLILTHPPPPLTPSHP